MTAEKDAGPVVLPTTLRRLWLWQHARRFPDHILIGWTGTRLTCGTCQGIPEDVLILGAHSRYAMPARWIRRITSPEVTR